MNVVCTCTTLFVVLFLLVALHGQSKTTTTKQCKCNGCHHFFTNNMHPFFNSWCTQQQLGRSTCFLWFGVIFKRPRAAVILQEIDLNLCGYGRIPTSTIRLVLMFLTAYPRLLCLHFHLPSIFCTAPPHFHPSNHILVSLLCAFKEGGGAAIVIRPLITENNSQKSQPTLLDLTATLLDLYAVM